MTRREKIERWKEEIVRLDTVQKEMAKKTQEKIAALRKKLIEERRMLATKENFGKQHGRQRYHFVISFPPGEASSEVAMEAARLFCEQYFGYRYEYVYAVHKDKAHTHAHIVFNSVSREDEYKYHYKKGDWEKFIQPVTDAVCGSLGLPPLEFELGVRAPGEGSYARWPS